MEWRSIGCVLPFGAVPSRIVSSGEDAGARMLTLKTRADDPSPDVIGAAVDVLRRGGVVAYPTDTLYGLAVDPRIDAAAARLFDLKGRGEAQAIPLIAAGMDQALAAADFDERAVRLARAFWPGPLTLVVRAKPGLSARILGAGGTVGIRVPAHPVARALAAGLGSLVTATSANRSGEPAVADPAALDPRLTAALDALVDAGPAPGGPPSTLVDLTAPTPRLLRAGAVEWERVLRSAARD